jgi:hypothetical protein
MSTVRKGIPVILIIGLLFVLAGLSDFFISPGFLDIAPRLKLDTTDKLLAGILIIALGLLHGSRWQVQPPERPYLVSKRKPEDSRTVPLSAPRPVSKMPIAVGSRYR